MGIEMKLNMVKSLLKTAFADPLQKFKPLFSLSDNRTPPIPLGKALVFALLAAFIAAPASAHSFKAGEIRIGHPWARPTADGAKTGEVYMAFLNQGEKPDQLLGASTSVAQKVVLVAGNPDGTVSDTSAIDLPLGRGVPMRPGATHLRLDGLKGGLADGDHFTLRLTFANEKPIDVMVMVQATPTENPVASSTANEPMHSQHDWQDGMAHDQHGAAQ